MRLLLGICLPSLVLAGITATNAAETDRAVTTVAAPGGDPASQNSVTRSANGKVPGTSCPLFPKRNYWRTPIKKLPVHKKSNKWRKTIGANRNLHPDFGPSFGAQSVPYGIPITVVGSGHAKHSVSFLYDSESDPGPYPLGADTRIEGGDESNGDRHAIIVDRSTCTLYETFDTRKNGGQWTAGSGAIWNLRSNSLRPKTWTSADAAGLPILPGLLRYDEIQRGKINHAIRFTAPQTRKKFVWPARHQAGASSAKHLPPMGARFRLKRSYSLSGWSKDARTVLKAMKKYGMVLADNGSPWYFQGTSDERWPISLVNELKGIPSNAFEAVNTKKMKIRGNSGKAKRR